jgi:GNAT superfamily N-acetyltransferase
MLAKKIVFTALFFSFLTTMPQEQQSSRPYFVQIVTGDALKELVPFIATERIIAFSEYPYLYAGNFTEEMSDLAAFAQAPDSAFAIAYYGETPVGLLTGCPLAHGFRYFKEPISIVDQENILAHRCYYFAEIIILPEHRGKKLTGKLFDALENHAKKLGYTQGALITESHESHPLKPTNYRSLEPLWNNKLNYKKMPLKLHASWRTYQPDGSAEHQEHTLHFWTKMLH